MFPKSSRFTQQNEVIDEDPLELMPSQSKRISIAQAAVIGQRLAQWKSNIIKKHTQEAIKQRMEEENAFKQQQEKSKQQSLRETNTSSTRLYEDAKRMNLTREQKIKREKESIREREEKDLKDCTFHPTLASSKYFHIKSKYMQNISKEKKLTDKKSGEFDKFDYHPKINTSYQVIPSDRNVFSRLYKDSIRRSNANEEEDNDEDDNDEDDNDDDDCSNEFNLNQEKRKKRNITNKKKLNEFLQRQSEYSERKKDSIDHLKRIYDPPFKPYVNEKSRIISEKLLERSTNEIVEEKEIKRDKRLLKQQDLHQHTKPFLTNLLKRTEKKNDKNSISSSSSIIKSTLKKTSLINKKIIESKEKNNSSSLSQTISKEKSLLKLNESKQDENVNEENLSSCQIESPSNKTKNKTKSKSISSIEASKFFYRQEEKVKVRNDHQLRLHIEKLVEEYVANSSNIIKKKSLNHSEGYPKALEESFYRHRCESMDENQGSRWNSSTLVERTPLLKEHEQLEYNNEITLAESQEWYWKQQELLHEKKQRLQEAQHALDHSYSFQPQLNPRSLRLVEKNKKNPSLNKKK